MPEHIWYGVSVEDEEASVRIRHLQEAPNGIRFLSVEPLVGPLDLCDALDGIAWCIVGGESGPGARFMNPGWARDIRDVCRDRLVPFFMKQMTKKGPIPDDLMVREWPLHLPAARLQLL